MHDDVSFQYAAKGPLAPPSRRANLRGSLLVLLIVLGGLLTVAWIGFLILYPISMLGLW